MKRCKMNHRINALICAAAIGAFSVVGCKDRNPDVPPPTVAADAPGTGAGSSESGVAGGSATAPGAAGGVSTGVAATPGTSGGSSGTAGATGSGAAPAQASGQRSDSGGGNGGKPPMYDK